MFVQQSPGKGPCALVSGQLGNDVGLWHEFCKEGARAQRLGLALGESAGDGERPAPGPGRLQVRDKQRSSRLRWSREEAPGASGGET